MVAHVSLVTTAKSAPDIFYCWNLAVIGSTLDDELTPPLDRSLNQISIVPIYFIYDVFTALHDGLCNPRTGSMVVCRARPDLES
jgi:hypothetical protein